MFVQTQKRASNLSNFSSLCYSVLCSKCYNFTLLSLSAFLFLYFPVVLQGIYNCNPSPLGLKPGTEALIISELCFAKLKAKHPSRGFLKYRGKPKKEKKSLWLQINFYSLCRKNPTDIENPKCVGVQSIMMADSMECSYCI